MIELGLIITILVAFFCMGLWYNRRNKNRKFDVYMYPLWHKIFLAALFSIPMFVGIFQYCNGRVLSGGAWSVIAFFTFCGGILVFYVWTTRYKIVGTELLAYEGLKYRRMEIESMCMVVKTIEHHGYVYLIVDNKDNKIKISEGILGVKGLIAEINERRWHYGYRDFTA